MRDLGGKVAVVTGAASGIGRAMAERFAASGMRLVLADIEARPLDEVAGALSAGGTDVLAVPTDVSVAKSVEELAAAASERFGPAHVVCNNAGVGAGGLTWQIPLSVWRWVVGVNMWGVIHGIAAFLPAMVERGEGHLVNTASVAGLLASPGLTPYAATKHAVVGISESLHHELALAAPGVKVSVLCPGAIATRIVDSERNWPERLGPRPEPATNPVMSEVGEAVRAHIEAGMAPSDVAALVLDAVTEERFWVLTHPEYREPLMRRADVAGTGGQPELFPVV